MQRYFRSGGVAPEGASSHVTSGSDVETVLRTARIDSGAARMLLPE